MRRMISVVAIALFAALAANTAYAQDKLTGLWEGTMQGPQGERPVKAIFKKEGEGYTGKMQGMRPGSEMQLKDVKFDGTTLTAKADVETGQGSFTINYKLNVETDAMKGQGQLDFSGQNFTLEMSLKRTSKDAPASLADAAPAAGQAQAQAPQGQQGQQGLQGQPRPPGQGGQGGGPPRREVPQPQQKQSADYFVGQWQFEYIGRESAFGPAPRDCTLVFTKRADGKSLDGAIACKSDAGSHQETWVMVFDEATKMFQSTEKRAGGVNVSSRGDWTSPIAIRFTVDPIKVKGQSLQLRRTIAIVAPHSFTIAEEISEDGGPFVRLGSAVVSKKM